MKKRLSNNQKLDGLFFCDVLLKSGSDGAIAVKSAPKSNIEL